MAERWKYRRGIGTWVSLVVLAVALGACGPAPAASPQSQTGEGAPVSAPPQQVAVTAYADEMSDPGKAVEPCVQCAGGIPPEDLTATPKMGGTLRIALPAGATLDPQLPSGTAGGAYHRYYGSGLLRQDLKTGSPQPDLAESWTVAKDAMSYDFKIRQGVKFHNLPPVNGREVTVQDVKWSFDRLSGLVARPGRLAIFARRYEYVKEFQVVDASTFRIVMKQPDSQLLSEISNDYMIVLPKEAAGPEDNFVKADQVIGSGPFMVASMNPAGDFRFKRNPNYWEKDKAGRQLPYMDGVDGAGAANDIAKIAAFKTQQLDWLVLPVPASRALLGDPAVRYYNGRGTAFGAIGLYMNVTIAPFKDIRVRQAVNLALDRVAFLQGAMGGLDAGYVVGPIGAWVPWSWSEDKLWSLPGYAKGEAKKKEKEEARRLMAEAGYANGIKNVQIYSGYPEQFDVLYQEMEDIGIELKGEFVGSVARNTIYMKDKFMGHARQGGGTVPDFAVTTAFLCTSVQNMSNYCNPEVDRLWKESRQERDAAKRVKLFDQIQQVLWDDKPMIPLTREAYNHMSFKYVRGWRNNWYDQSFSQGYQVAWMWLDK